jgi:catechol-2,3-dioxygenase
MSQLRQLVIAAEDPNRLASFYQEVFALEKIEENQGAVFMSDGTFNLALLPEADPAKQGFRHMGFDTTRMRSICAK